MVLQVLSPSGEEAITPGEYGHGDADGLSPTEGEFDVATWFFVVNVYANVYH